jgi:glutathione peroxidase
MIKTVVAVALAGIMLLAAGGPSRSQAPTGVAFDYEFESIEGGKLALAKWRGKVLLVINTASFCGFTHQYSGLQTLWERYEQSGLVIVGVPSNDFAGQEPNSEAEIKGFCQGAFGITFPLTSKQVVSGPQAHPFYQWARDILGASRAPRWNFHKYLVARDGRLIGAYAAGVEPLSPELIGAIEAALAAS